MLTPSLDILPWLAAFAPAMTAPTLTNALTLLCGTLLAPGRRTVTAALRVLGLETDNFSKYHRFFSRARWSALLCSRLLLFLLLRSFLPPGAPLVIVVDDTLERRQSRKLPYRGLFRDPVRSTRAQVQFTWGVRWLCFALVVPVPGCRRRWALPFLVLPLLSEKTCERLGKRHKTAVEVTALVVGHLSRWLPEREIRVIGDGSFAALSLAHQCQQAVGPVCLISRLRLDAALHAFPGPRPKSKRGPKPQKGARLPRLQDRLTDPTTPWQTVTLRWYNGEVRTLELVSDVCLWYRPKQRPVPLRWVLVRSPQGDPHPIEAGACFCTDPARSAVEVVAAFVLRWNIEVTFAEVRAHLGFETQRHWSRPATGRVVPCLFGVFSLVVLAAKELHPETLPVPQSAWYPKAEPTFADALAAVRRYLWSALHPVPQPPAGGNYVHCPADEDLHLIPGTLWHRLLQVVCYAN
jgi:hypothetical protein